MTDTELECLIAIADAACSQHSLVLDYHGMRWWHDRLLNLVMIRWCS